MKEHKQAQRRVANYFGALAHLLGGQPGRATEFRQKVEILLAGSAANATTLMQGVQFVRLKGKPVLWIHQSQENPHIPQIGLVAEVEGRMFFMENCMLWLGEGADRALLVPDSFNLGAFRFDDTLSLTYEPTAPSRTFEAAQSEMGRAYNRLISIGIEQWERGDVFDLPNLLKAA